MVTYAMDTITFTVVYTVIYTILSLVQLIPLLLVTLLVFGSALKPTKQLLEMTNKW